MRKIFSAALALVCVWFATPAHADNPCRNLANLNDTTYAAQYWTVDTSTGTISTEQADANFSFWIRNAKAGEQYIMSADVTAVSGGGMQFQVRDSSNQVLSAMGGAGTVGRDVSTAYTIPSDGDYRFNLRTNGSAAFTATDIQIEKGSTATAYTPYDPQCATCDGTIVNYTSATGTVSRAGTPTPTNPIEPTFYKQGNMVLRKGGDYADSYDASTGKITRRVGVKVLDGTENWGIQSINDHGIANYQSTMAGMHPSSGSNSMMSSHFGATGSLIAESRGPGLLKSSGDTYFIRISSETASTVAQFKSWLAAQKAAGTPVTIYYVLENPVEEDWTETSYCETPIKIATTKYNETAFGPLNTALANAISVVDTVVSNTITQAASIATLQAQKQTRPNDIADDNEKCPAGKKCLLVEDASGVPHWYEIVERYSRLPDGYTELEYLTSGTDGQYIDTGILFDPTKNFRVVGNFINPYATLRKVILGNYYSQQSETYYSIELYTDGKFRNYMSADGGSAFNIYSPTAVPADTIAYFDTSYDALAHQTTTTLRYGTTEQTYSGATPETTTVAVHTLKLFNDKRNLSPVYNNPVSIGAVQIYIDDILAHHYVPARRESDNVLGMYDTVSGQFFTNQGTGEFVAGDPVSE